MPNNSQNPAGLGEQALDIETLVQWAEVVVSGAVTLVLLPVAIYAVRYWWDRRRWHAYEQLIRAWACEEFLPEELTDQDWRALAALKLSEAGFEPRRTAELMELAVWFAKGTASLEQWGRITQMKEEEGNG